VFYEVISASQKQSIPAFRRKARAGRAYSNRQNRNAGGGAVSDEQEYTLNTRLNDGRSLPIESCCCGHCKNEWFMAALSPEWCPNHCPYCGVKFVRMDTDGEPVDYEPADAMLNVIEERDKAQDAADEMASLILGEPIDWPFHGAAWSRAIAKLNEVKPCNLSKDRFQKSSINPGDPEAN